MQKFVLLSYLLILVFTQITAQKNFYGVKAAVGYVQLQTSTEVSMSPTLGGSIGVSYLRVLRKNWEMIFDVTFEAYRYEGFTRLTYLLLPSEKASLNSYSGTANVSFFHYIDSKKHFKLGAGFWLSAINNANKYPVDPPLYWGTSDFISRNYIINNLFGSDFGPSLEAIYCFSKFSQMEIKYRIGTVNQNFIPTKSLSYSSWNQNFISLNFIHYFNSGHSESSIFKKRPSESFKKEKLKNKD